MTRPRVFRCSFLLPLSLRLLSLLVVVVVVSVAAAAAPQEQLLELEQKQPKQQSQQDQHQSVRRHLQEGEIVGGSIAGDGEFPWFAAFVPMVKCGGSLIAPNRVLTAAHCIQGGAPKSVKIGPTTLTNGETIGVTCVSKHPDFKYGSSGDLLNDVAILKLSGSSSATPITLNNDINYPSEAETPLTVIGFGTTSEGGSTSCSLKKLQTYFQTIETCQLNYPGVEFGTHVCGDVDNEGDCQGDSGGPLFDANQKQIGIVSYGFGCARSSEDVYAGVAKSYDWIQEQINTDDCNVKTTTSCGLVDTVNGLYDGLQAFVRYFSP